MDYKERLEKATLTVIIGVINNNQMTTKDPHTNEN